VTNVLICVWQKMVMGLVLVNIVIVALSFLGGDVTAASVGRQQQQQPQVPHDLLSTKNDAAEPLVSSQPLEKDGQTLDEELRLEPPSRSRPVHGREVLKAGYGGYGQMQPTGARAPAAAAQQPQVIFISPPTGSSSSSSSGNGRGNGYGSSGRGGGYQPNQYSSQMQAPAQYKPQSSAPTAVQSSYSVAQAQTQQGGSYRVIYIQASDAQATDAHSPSAKPPSYPSRQRDPYSATANAQAPASKPQTLYVVVPSSSSGNGNGKPTNTMNGYAKPMTMSYYN